LVTARPLIRQRRNRDHFQAVAYTAYDVDLLRKTIAAKGAVAVIPNPTKQFRSVATHFEKTARNDLTVVTIALTSYGCCKCPPNLGDRA
jgi:hypothetical protein